MMASLAMSFDRGTIQKRLLKVLPLRVRDHRFDLGIALVVELLAFTMLCQCLWQQKTSGLQLIKQLLVGLRINCKSVEPVPVEVQPDAFVLNAPTNGTHFDSLATKLVLVRGFNVARAFIQRGKHFISDLLAATVSTIGPTCDGTNNAGWIKLGGR